MPTTAFIVDDERKARDLLRALLLKRHPDIKLLGEASNVEAALLAMQDKRPDILFLDVDLGGRDELNGFDLLQRLESPKPMVIFTTGDPKHALAAIAAEATHYLVKPFDGPRFDEAVLRALRLLESGRGPRAVAAPYGMLISDQQLALPDTRGLTMVHLDEVLYCESDNQYTSVHRTSARDPVVVSKRIALFEEALRPKGFIRIHQSFLVNRKHIRQYLRGEGGEVILSNGKNLPVSRRQKPGFLDELDGI